MRNSLKTLSRLGVVAGITLACSAPAFAQASDAFAYNGTDAQGQPGWYDHGGNTYTQTNNTGNWTPINAPNLQGSAYGVIGPQGTDATVITGINTAGTVRVNNLSNLEALLNIIANGMEILGIAWGGPTIIMGFMHMAAGTQDAMKRVLWGVAGTTGGLATPACINWLVASARDANMFA